MRILFDQGVPVPLRRYLHPHTVDTAAEMGWSMLVNGDLIRQAEAHGYDIMVTTDQNLKYQQNLKDRVLNIVVLMTTSWPRIKQEVDQIVQTVSGITGQGEYVEVEFL